jgi:hypothetical protein
MLINTLGSDRRRALENVCAAADRIWSRPLHRYYTDHTVTHSERIITLLDGLTAGMMATGKSLSPIEVFVLLAAAYLHDIGMQDERFAGGDLEEIRAHHHEVTAELIYCAAGDPSTGSGRRPAQAVDLGLPGDPGLVEAVALVAKGHRRVDLNSAEYEPLVHGGETLRLRLLAALLRFGDELDIDYRRVDLETMKLLTLPVESQLHWWKCHYVSGVSIGDEYIRIAYRFPLDRPDYEQFILPLVEREVRAKHAALETIFRADAVKVALGPSQVRLMRPVKPLSVEVEALARHKVEGIDEVPPQPPTPAAPARVPTGKPATPPASPSPRPAPVFDLRGQRFEQQVVVAGDYVDQRTSYKTIHHPSAVFDYEHGLRRLQDLITEGAPTLLSEFHTLEARLLDNLRDERLYGGTETSRAERARVVDALNDLARRAGLSPSFNDLCRE